MAEEQEEQDNRSAGKYVTYQHYHWPIYSWHTVCSIFGFKLYGQHTTVVSKTGKKQIHIKGIVFIKDCISLNRAPGALFIAVLNLKHGHYSAWGFIFSIA